MYKQGQLIAVNGELYEYDGIVNPAGTMMHKVYEIDIDETGHLTATYGGWYFTDAELQNNEVQFTEQQWRGLVQHFLVNDYDLADEEIDDAVEDIVDRCFAYGIPKIHELEGYIAEYMNR